MHLQSPVTERRTDWVNAQGVGRLGRLGRLGGGIAHGRHVTSDYFFRTILGFQGVDIHNFNHTPGSYWFFNRTY